MHIRWIKLVSWNKEKCPMEEKVTKQFNSNTEVTVSYIYMLNCISYVI
jgi:hypothetical protein